MANLIVALGPISVLREKFNPRNINHSLKIKFSARLDLGRICLFLDGHYKPSQKKFSFKIKADSGFKPEAYSCMPMDLKPGSYKDIGPKAFFEMACIKKPSPDSIMGLGLCDRVIVLGERKKKMYLSRLSLNPFSVSCQGAYTKRVHFLMRCLEKQIQIRRIIVPSFFINR